MWRRPLSAHRAALRRARRRHRPGRAPPPEGAPRLTGQAVLPGREPGRARRPAVPFGRALTPPREWYRWAIAVQRRDPYLGRTSIPRRMAQTSPHGGVRRTDGRRTTATRRGTAPLVRQATARSAHADRPRPPHPSRRAAPDRRRGQRPPGSGQPVPRRHRRVVRPVRGRPGRPVDLRRFADAPDPRRPARPVRGDHRDRRHAAAGRPDRGDGCPPRADRPGHRRRPEPHPATAPDDLPARRRTDHLLRPDRLPRRPARAARAVPHDRLRLDRGRDRPRPRLRRPHRDRHRQCAPGRLDADDDRAAAGDLRARRPAQPAPGRGRHRPGDRGRGRPVDRPRHDPGLSGRPRRRHVRADRVPGRLPRRDQPRPRDAAGRRRPRAHRLGRRARRIGPAG